MQPNYSSYDVLVKTLVIGDAGVGKSTFCTRLTTGNFHRNYSSTIGIDFFIKFIEIYNKVFKLQIWDTAGQEKFQSIISSYFRNSQLVIVMVDLNNPNGLTNLNKWLDKIDDFCKPEVNIIMIGNKDDLEINIDFDKLNTILQERDIPYVQISVKNNSNFDELIQIIHNKIYKLPLNYHEFESIELKEEKKKKLFECCTIL